MMHLLLTGEHPNALEWSVTEEALRNCLRERERLSEPPSPAQLQLFSPTHRHDLLQHYYTASASSLLPPIVVPEAPPRWMPPSPLLLNYAAVPIAPRPASLPPTPSSTTTVAKVAAKRRAKKKTIQPPKQTIPPPKKTIPTPALCTAQGALRKLARDQVQEAVQWIAIPPPPPTLHGTTTVPQTPRVISPCQDETRVCPVVLERQAVPTTPAAKKKDDEDSFGALLLRDAEIWSDDEEEEETDAVATPFLWSDPDVVSFLCDALDV